MSDFKIECSDVDDDCGFFKGSGLKIGHERIHSLTIMGYEFTDSIAKVKIYSYSVHYICGKHDVVTTP